MAAMQMTAEIVYTMKSKKLLADKMFLTSVIHHDWYRF